MVEVIGQCEKVAKKATCKNCGAILRYYEKDTRVRRYTTMGERDSDIAIVCPQCKKDVVVKS